MARGSWWSAGALLSAVAVFVVSWKLTRGEAGIGDAARGSAGSDGPGIEAADASRGPRFAAAPESEAAASDGGGARQGVAYELRGRLIDETGAAVEGAEVRAGSVTGVSSRRGTFALALPARDLLEGSLRVLASTASGRIGTTRAPIGGRDPRVIQLSRARTLTVHVRKSGGGPAEGVVVDAVALDDPDDEAPLRSGVTSAEGSVALRGLPATPLALRTRSGATVPTRQRLGRGYADQEAFVVVEPAPALALVALDDERRPVAGARAVVSDLVLGGALALTSDDHGRFPATGLSKHRQRIVVTHHGHATAVATVDPARASEKEREIVQEVVLHAAGEIEVAIESPLWQRAGEGAWIVDARPDGQDELPRLRDATGSRPVVVLDGANPGSTYELFGRYYGRSGSLAVGPLRIAEAVRADRQRIVQHWKLPELFRVTAECRGAKGVPLRDATVSLVATRASSEERCDFAADEFGSAVGYVAGGTYRIEAHSPTAAVALRQTEIVVSEDCNLDVVFTRGRTVRGTVAAADGNPLCREVVAEGGGSTRTAWSDGAGRFELHGIPPGPCKVGARGKYGEPVAGSVDVVAEGDVDDCRVVLESGALVGRVTGLRGERARVTMRAGDARGDLSHASDVVVMWTDPNGDFRIDDAGAGEWSVLAESESEYGKGAGQAQQVGGVGRWSGVVRGVTKLQIDVAWK